MCVCVEPARKRRLKKKRTGGCCLFASSLRGVVAASLQSLAVFLSHRGNMCECIYVATARNCARGGAREGCGGDI